jgi:hypothetical protein
VRRGTRWFDGGGGAWGPIVGLLLVLASANGSSAHAVGGGGFSVQVSADPVETETGLPVDFLASVGGGVPPYTYSWTSSSNLTGAGANFSAWASTAGNLTVTVVVLDGAGELAAASYVEPVLPSPTITLGVANVTDAGIPFSVVLGVSGGVAPYSANLTLNGAPLAIERFPASGTIAVPAMSPSTGPINVTAAATDALGEIVRAAATVAGPAPRPSVALAGGPTAVEAGVEYTWWADVVGGTPPIQWTVVPAGPAGNVSGPGGSSTSPGTIAWSARFNDTGNDSVGFYAADAAGSVAAFDLPVRVAPRVQALLSVPTGGAVSAVNLTIVGGVPPYELDLSASDGETWVGNASVAGTFTWTLAPRATGELNVSAWVADGAGGVAIASLALPNQTGSSPAPTNDPPGSIGTLSLVLLALGAVGGAAVDRLLRRRSKPTPTPPPAAPPAIEEVKQILDESDGLERETVCVTGEERGRTREAIEAGIDHWMRLGRIETIRGSGGEEFLRWKDQNEPASSEPP